MLKCKEPFCWAVRSFPHSQTKQNIKRLQGFSPWNISRKGPRNARKKAVLAPFAPFYSTYPFCWAVFHKCSTEPHFMFHNDYQLINKNRLRNEIPWNTMFHALFFDVPRNVPRTLCAIKWSSLFPVSWYLYYIMFTRAQHIVETCHWCVSRLPTWVFSRRRNATSPHGLSPIIWLSDH